MAKDRAGFHVDMMAFDPKDSFGANVGNNPGDQTVGPGERKTYTYYAHPEYGELAALIQDWGTSWRIHGTGSLVLSSLVRRALAIETQ